MDKENKFYFVVLDVEFLPGKRVQMRCSVDYVDIELAKHSLSHVQRIYPDARLFFMESFDEPDEEEKTYLKQIRHRDKQYHEQFMRGENE